MRFINVVTRGSIAALMCLFALQANSASITLQGSMIRIEGGIEAGDVGKLKSLLKTPEGAKAFSRNGVFILNSPGGLVQEAVKIARIVELSFGTTVVSSGAKCFSACFLIFAAGSYRVIGDGAALGVHRVSRGQPGASELDNARSLARVATLVDKYLASRGVPAQVITKMNGTPASEMFMFGSGWMIAEGINDVMAGDPAFMVKVHSRCGEDPFLSEAQPLGMQDHKAWLGCMAHIRHKSRDESQVQFQELMGEQVALVNAKVEQ